MNKNILIVLGGAVAIAVVVAMMVQLTIGGKKEVKEIQEARVQVLVAAKDLKIGDELAEGDMRWQDWPEGGIFPGAIQRAEDQMTLEALEGRLARDVTKGEPMLKTALLGQTEGNLVAASLEPGMRAIAIEVSAASMVGGFIEPGDFVDVILTYSETVRTDDEDPDVQSFLELNLEKYATETILQNVKVLAIDQDTKREAKAGKPKVGKTATVEVGARDAERLALSSRLGELNLVLRGVGDDKIVKKEWPTVSDARLTSINNEILYGYKKLKKNKGITGTPVRIYRGDQMNVVTPQ
ncbi:MAG: Flp pilus assembly protein CpaB [Pseudomonadota bacterium]